MRLSDWQRQLESYLLSEDAEAMQALLPQLRDGPALSGAGGLRIYHNAYRARLLETLRGDYPALHAWLGDDEFDALLRAYLNAHPPSHFSLRWLGRDLAAFLERHLVPEQAAPLAELARLEWAFTLAFDAADASALGLADVAALPAEAWPALRVAAHPSLQRLPCRYNSLALWRAVKAGADFPGSQPLAREELCLVWRQELVCRYRALAADEADALQCMLAGASFAELCAELAASHAERAPALAAGWLKQWLQDGLLTPA
ncbi:MAG: putative DNA-binding domain-containing protein [Pseudomonadaceae bacterium]|nr:putative DNA-binding domain-containing protein [Pseudomonadaceae bacterium]